MPRSVLGLLVTLALLLVGSLGTTTATALAGGGCHGDVTGKVHNDATTSVVRMDICSFEPTVAHVPVGGEVTFLNTAVNEHVVVGRASTWGGDSLGPGDRLVQRFDRAGVFPYTCPLHPGMVGAIVVGEADLAAPIVVQPGTESSAGGTATATAADESAIDGQGTAVVLGAVGGGLLVGLLAIAVRRRPAGGASAL